MTVKLERALATEGFMTAHELRWLAEHARRAKVIIEVGCWKGRSTRALGDNVKGVVYACDTWAGSNHYYAQQSVQREGGPDGLFRQFRTNVADLISQKRIVPIRLDGRDHIERLRALLPTRGADMLFIDGDHRYKYVLYDLLAYGGLVRSGGLIAGHDVYHRDVIKVLRECFGPRPGKGFHCMDERMKFVPINHSEPSPTNGAQKCIWWVQR